MRHPRSRCPFLGFSFAPALWIVAGALVAPLLLLAQGTATSVLQVGELRLEPVRQGKNVVRVTVRNPSGASRNLVLGIYASSPDYGRGMGWGTQFPETLPPGVTRELRFAFKIPGPVTDRTRLVFTFYEPADPANFDSKSYFLRRQVMGTELERARPDSAASPAPADEAAAAIAALEGFQDALRTKAYRAAFESVTGDFRSIYFGRTEDEFAKNIAAPDSGMRPYLWSAEALLEFSEATAVKCGDGRLLLGGAPGAGLEVYLAREAGGWKIDEIAGYTPRAVLWANWEERLLPTLASRRSERFDIYFRRGSSAEREIDRIAAERDRGFDAIAGFLGLRPGFRIKLVFFEDAKTKAWETGHEGAGWAYDRTIVEVFNRDERLDPFHEVCHILAGEVGDPPALFDEGLAVYMSERLGAPALKGLGGGTLTVDERVRQLWSRGERIPLAKLLEFTEIGSDESKPDIAYAEAASFVKFLVEEFGREKFLAAYRAVKRPTEAGILEANKKIIVDIFGADPDALESAWEKKLNKLGQTYALPVLVNRMQPLYDR